MLCGYSINAKLKIIPRQCEHNIVSFAVFLKTKQQTEYSLYRLNRKINTKPLLLFSCQHLFQVSSWCLTTSAGKKVINEILGMLKPYNL